MASIKYNSLVDDPSLAAATKSLSGLFSPPSGTDAYGWAHAAAAQQKVQQVRDLWAAAAGDPDKQATIAGLYNPTQSYKALDMGDATTRRGQDVAATTSRGNNLLDNQRSLVASMYGPVARDSLRPEVPASVTGLFGLPAMAAQRGMINLNPGDVSVQPDGTRIEGAPKPLNLSEQEARILGTMDPKLQQSRVLAGPGVVDVVRDGVPVVESTAGSIGQPSYQKPATGNNAVWNYTAPGGVSGTAILGGPDGKTLVDSHNKQPLPAGAGVHTAQATGKPGEMDPTAANRTSANNQEAETARTLGILDMYDETIRRNPQTVGLTSVIKGAAQDVAATARDLTASFGDKAPQIAQYAAEIDKGLQTVAPGLYDKDIPRVRFMQGALAYSLARTENPSGEVSRQAYDNALKRVQGGGVLANTTSAQAEISAFRDLLRSRQKGIEVLRNPGTGPTDMSYRPPGSAAPATPAASGRLRFDENGNPL